MAPGRCAAPYSSGTSHVEHRGALVDRRAHLRRRERLRIAGARQRLRPVLRDDPIEVRGLGGQARHELADEGVDVAGVEGRVEAALEADRGRGLARHGPAAARPGPVGGIHLDAVRQDQEPRGEALVQARRRVLAAEVRPADIADEQRVPGQHEPRLVAPGRVGHEKADAVGRVPRRVDDLERDRSHAQLLAVLDRGVGEGRLGRGMDVDARPGLGGEGLVARDVVGVQVGLDDVGDCEALLSAQSQVLVDPVPPGIDHHGLAGATTADQVRETAGLLVEHLLKDHGRNLPTWADTCASAEPRVNTRSAP